MKTLFTSALILLFSMTSIAQTEINVLFIGNSYTSSNNLPFTLSEIANSFGNIVNYDTQTPGGYTLEMHANDPTTYTKIQGGVWDYVVIQAQSQEPSFPDNQVNTQTLPYAMQLADSIFANDICTEVVYFMTWGRENGDPQWGPISTFKGMNSRLRLAYMRFADSTDASVCPVGSAWNTVRDSFPTIPLYQTDGSHPNAEGTYLAACTFYASLFRESPIGSTYTSGLGPMMALDLQTTAHNAVLDSLNLWNLKPKSELVEAEFSHLASIATVNFTNESIKADSYAWDFGDGTTSVLENPSHTYLSNGIYNVELVALSPCDSDTISYQVDIQGLGLLENSHGLKIISHAENWFEIEGYSNLESIEIIDIHGRMIPFVLDQNKFQIRGEVHSQYFLKVENQFVRLPIGV